MTYDRILIARMLRNQGDFGQSSLDEQADLLDAAENACDIQKVSDKIAKLKELSERAHAARATCDNNPNIFARFADYAEVAEARDQFEEACVNYVRELIAGGTP